VAVAYTPIDGEQVSREWGVVLHDMRQAGVAFRVNEGKRTFARQLFFWRLYLSGRGNLAARPSHNAPHIRTGRIDHAIDFNNATGVVYWLRQHAIRATLPVPGESWHVEAPAAALVKYAADHGGGDPVIRPRRPNPTAAVKRLQKLLAGLNLTDTVNGRYDLRTRRAVRRFQHRHAMKVDGTVGPATWAALRAASNK